ncbi:hypothetical protein R3X27_24720 [Tropicimonas sp. TH_r6]|uniref:hypothetical protein n=1 Tax=Tropicimonas sp. TH_r6 TaxID=3082085 RepID=UPI0029542D03|nr:hypothetical protein [Tropicimonas sp. TH_r6]MDV7145895.1 hypothetical protein [Tropicimonas sp. TH_r6]
MTLSHGAAANRGDEQHMSHLSSFSGLSTRPVKADLAVVRAFLSMHGTALHTASELLGGEPRGRRWLAFLDEIRSATQLTRRHRVALHEAFNLLSLGTANENGVDGASGYVEVDPYDPRVHDLCILTERLAELLQRFDKDGRSPADAWKQEPVTAA